MAVIKQDIPNRVTVYHDNIDQEQELKNAMLPEKPRYFNGAPTYKANSIEEFESKIYPVLTGNLGSEWNPGIDKDSRITILIHPMNEEAGEDLAPSPPAELLCRLEKSRR